ncbi:AAA family ATPase [Pseudomonas sp. PDM16]|uniref:BTAD domain-containing putative transcriptional regulator n=1 Tax=Pseudomonas sp. PDM16 TaxID=2769292 RepID=UPI001786AE6F|nr:AAA family ATPase [Pseudomonas sp. PDM16]MBD9413916.1 AAA family ATPase [Pseudomonas sp. PDM16]
MEASRPIAPLQLTLLGGFSVAWHNEPLDGFNYDKMRALLAYLSLEHHREHSRETLAALLWESSPAETWRGNLRRTLSDLRRVLETPTGLDLFEASKNSLRFVPDGHIDVLRFRRGPQRCTSHPACQQCPSCIEELEAAATLYRGDFLAGLDLPDCPDFEDWLLLQRESLRCHALALLEHLSNLFEQRGERQRALPHARRLVELDPWQESGQLRLMRLLAQNGQSAAALSQYESFRNQLWKELGVHPGKDCQELQQRIRDGQLRAEIPLAEACAVGVPPPPAERRQVTVLYCEISIPGCADPEEALEQLGAPQAQCLQVIRAHGGHVVQAHGGGLLAYFGYPRARENAARLAAQAALALPQACAPAQVRCGLHTGLIVTAAGQLLPDATGITSDIAVQVRQHADYQQVVVGTATHRLLEGYFRCLPLPASLPGAGALYHVEEASGARHRLAVQPRLTPLVGRDTELDRLLTIWTQVRESRTSICALLRADPGVGKSRLLHELGKRLNATHPGQQVVLRCLEQHTSDPFFPVAELIAHLCAFAPGSSAEQRYLKLSDVLRRIFTLDNEARDLIADLLGLPLPQGSPVTDMPRDIWRARMLETLLTIVRANRSQPLLLVMEDVHWADASTVQLIERLLREPERRPLLLLLSARPEFPTQALEPLGMQVLELPHLSQDMARMLVEGLPQALAEPQLRRVLALADGVPLFIEELVQWVSENNTQGDIPLTLNDLLMARIDGLEDARTTAQLAACIGREFHLELIQALHPQGEQALGHDLETLLRAGLIEPGSQASLRQFKHALIQQAAYQAQPKAQRRETHQRIAEVLQERFPARCQHAPGQLAHHLTEAGRFEQALPLWKQAGESAQRFSANREAADHFQRALGCLDRLPTSPWRDGEELALQLVLGAALNSSAGYGAASTQAAFSRALVLGQQLQQPEASFRALVGVWGCCDSFDKATVLGQQVLAAAEQSGQLPLRLLGHMCHLGGAFWSRPLAESRAIAETIVALCDTPARQACMLGFGEDPLVNSRAYLCLGLWVEGFPQRARQLCAELLSDVRTQGSANAISHALVFASMLHCLLDDAPAVAEMAQETLNHSRGKGLQLWEDIATVMVGWSRVALGDADGLRELQRGIDANRQSMPVIGVTLATLQLDALARLGQHEELLQRAELVVQTAHERCDRYLLPEAMRLQAEALYDTGEDGRASSVLEEAQALAESLGAGSLRLRLAISRLRRQPSRQSHQQLQVLLNEGDGGECTDRRIASSLLVQSLPDVS